MAADVREFAAGAAQARRHAIRGPTGGKAGVFPEHRAALGFRAAVAVMTAGILTFAELDESVYHWVRNAFSPFLGIIVILCVQPDLGRTTQSCVKLGIGVSALTMAGTAVAALCYVIGGFQFIPLVMAVGVCITIGGSILLANIAAVIHAPQVLIFADQTSCFWATLPLVAFLDGKGDLTDLLKYMTSSLLWFTVAAAVSYYVAILPCGLGAYPARRLVPSHLASVLECLGGYVSTVAARRSSDSPLPQAVDRRRQLRHEVLKTSARLRDALKNGTFERCGGYCGQTTASAVVSRSAEVCRLAVTLQHAANSHPCASTAVSRNMYYRGPFNDGVLELQYITAETLHAAGSLIAHIAGHASPSTTLVGLHDEDRRPFADAACCRSLAEECRDEVHEFRQKWLEWSLGGWRDRFQDVYKDVKSVGNAGESHMMSNVPLREVCAATASHLGAFSAAQAAAEAAEAAAEMAEEVSANSSRCCALCFPCIGSIGIGSWLLIPYAGPTVWKKGILQGMGYALQQIVALGSMSFVVAVAPDIWPNGANPGFWAILSAGLCITPVLGAVLIKSLRRLIGTILGAAAAFTMVIITKWEYSALWLWLGITAFLVKFFEKEVQYGGLVFFITVSVIVAVALENEHDTKLIWDVSVARCEEIGIGVIVAGIVSMIIAPTRATKQLRLLELEALSLAAYSISATSVALSKAASDTGARKCEGDDSLGPFVPLLGKKDENDEESEESEDETTVTESEDSEHGAPTKPRKPRGPSLNKLRENTWELIQSFFFGGDGLPGIGDTLSDSRWETRFCADAGFEFAGGLLWFPTMCCPCLHAPALAPGRHCLSAVQSISRLMRQSHVLVALIGKGFAGGGDVLLSEAEISEALGQQGEDLADAVQRVVASIVPLLSAQGTDGLEGAVTKMLISSRMQLMRRDALEAEALDPRGVAIAAAMAGLEDVNARLNLLLAGAHKGRHKARGGLMTQNAAGEVVGGNSHRIAAVLFILQNASDTLRDIVKRLAGEDHSANDEDDEDSESTLLTGLEEDEEEESEQGSSQRILRMC